MASLYSLFDNVSTRAAEQAAMRFEHVQVAAGQAICTEGEINDSMLFIETGEVVVMVGGLQVTRMTAGAILGEIGLFTRAVRTATVQTTTPVNLHILTRRAFTQLRNTGNPIAFRIERRAIEQLGGRIRQLTADVVAMAHKKPRMLLPIRTTAEYDGHPIRLTDQRIHDTLRAATAFYGAPPKAIQELVSLVEARTYNAGDTLAAEALSDGPLYILAHGQVDCVASVGIHHQVRVATLQPGEVFNLIQHVDEKPRPVSYVAHDGVSLLSIRREDVQRLLARNDLVGSTLRIAMIRSLSDRVNKANATFALGSIQK